MALAQCVWQVTVELLWYYSASHLLPICLWYHAHTHTNTRRSRPWIQASLTLNLAQADSNFCLQITFQWLHKSAASSSASFSPPPSSCLCFSIFLSFSLPPLVSSSLPFYSSLTSFFPYKPPPSSFPSLPLFHHLSFSIQPPTPSSPLYHLFSRFPPLLLSGAGSVNEKQGGRDGVVTCAG